MKNKIDSKYSNLISLFLMVLAAFILLYTDSEKTENALAQIQNNTQGATELITQATGEENEKIVQQGVATSSPDPLPGHEAHQSVTILRLKGDNTVYDGTLSFISSKPVEVQLLYRNMTSPNATQFAPPQINPQFGTMNIISLSGQGSVISSLIQPQYPEDATSFSASLPFAANGLALHNLDGDEFVTTYTVVADQVGPAQRADEIINPPTEADDNDNEDEEDEDEEDDDKDNN